MTTLGDYVTLVTGFAFPSSRFNYSGIGQHVLRGDNIGQGELRWLANHSAFWEDEPPADVSLRDGDVAIAMDRPWVSAGLKFATISDSDLPALLGQRVAVLRAKKHVSQRFLHYVAGSRQFTTYIVGCQTGTAVPHISGDQLRQYPVSMPPLPEQQAIAEVLGALDDKIAANRKLATTSLDLAQAVHDLALSDEQRPLRDVIALEYGKSLPATRRIPGSIPVVGSGGITGSHSEALVNRPGIVVGRKGSMGTVRWMDAPFFPIDTTFYVKNKTDLPEQFWYFSLKQVRFDGLNSDSAVPGLNRDAALDQLIRIPDEQGVERFKTVALPLFGLATSLNQESATLAELRDTLLPALMDGTIRVKGAQQKAEEVL